MTRQKFRPRNRHVREILLWAPRLPEYDKESGSKRVFDFLVFLCESRWKVTFVAEQPGEERYVRVLERLGVQTCIGMTNELKQQIGSGRFGTALLFFWRLAERCLPLIRSLSPNTCIIVDSVDLHFLRNARRLLHRQSLIDAGLNLDFGSEMIREINIYAAADAVFTVSSTEATLVRAFLGNSTPATPVPDLEDMPLLKTPFSARRGILFVGNFWHRPNVDAVEYFCERIVPQIDPVILADHPLYVLGHALDKSVFRSAAFNPNVRLIGWVPSLLPYLETCRVSVAPLLYGAGTKRKVIQSLMAGTPMVSTSIGIEGLPIENGRDILVADDAGAFAYCVVRLLRDEKLWRRLQRNGRTHVSDVHSRKAAKIALFGALSQATAEFIPRSPSRRKILVLGVYLADQPNYVEHIVDVLRQSATFDVTQRWAAIGMKAPAQNVADVTIKAIAGLKGKFEILNDLLRGANMNEYEYAVVIDDDIRIPNGFLDDLISFQSKAGFDIAQPARTRNSYIDLPIVEQQSGVAARQTWFVEIGPVVSFHKSIYHLILPFDVSSPMGWGYSNVWSYRLRENNKKMGIIDSIAVEHSIRKPVTHYEWAEADRGRRSLLSRNPHLSYDECFRVVEVITVAGDELRRQPFGAAPAHPLISVIIPFHNQRARLQQALESFESQNLSHSDFEVVLIDDGSADDSAAVWRHGSWTLSAQYVAVEHSGTPAAYNLGVFSSRSPIVLFFDVETVAHRDLLREHLRFHAENPHERLALRSKIEWHTNSKPAFAEFTGGCTSFKRSLLAWNGVFNQEFRFGMEDLELAYRLSKAGLLIARSEHAIQYRHRPLTVAETRDLKRKRKMAEAMLRQLHPGLGKTGQSALVKKPFG